eukprot:TRINITY_DN565_c0_g2_i1.p1 TRINITY_DN565_c0_g2~~TRINITY_DN565_c0_g2_i1.p1  ORF type:complete len:176 (+),score=46.14 TRINITY_DN565_c0_g2_i1:26-529(+)
MEGQQGRYVTGPGAMVLNAFNILLALLLFATSVYRFFIGATDFAFYIVNSFLLVSSLLLLVEELVSPPFITNELSFLRHWAGRAVFFMLVGSLIWNPSSEYTKIISISFYPVSLLMLCFHQFINKLPEPIFKSVAEDFPAELRRVPRTQEATIGNINLIPQDNSYSF